MKRILVLLLCLSARVAIAACTPPTGIGCDVPTSVVATASGADAATATFTWTTVHSSDSMVTLVDGLGNSGQTFYNATLTTSHSVTATMMPQNIKSSYFVSSCSHASDGSTFGGIQQTAGNQCPFASPDWSSTGPSGRLPVVPTVTTIARPAGTLSSWFVNAYAPTNVFQGQEFYVQGGVGVGAGTTGTSGANYVLMHDVIINGPSGYGVSGVGNCGQTNSAHSPTYRSYGDATGIVPCLGGSAASDFILTLPTGTGFVYPSTSNFNNFFFANGSTGTLGSQGQRGYYYLGWTGNDLTVYVKVGASVPAGSYTINIQLQPLLNNGTGNETGGLLVGQNKTISIPINVQSVVALHNNPPSSFPAWSFQGQYYAMVGYWTTWMCSNVSAIVSGTGSWAGQNNSGTYENTTFSPNGNFTAGGFAWVYDGGRNHLGAGEHLYRTTYPDWLASHTYFIGDRITDSISGFTFILDLVNGAASPGLSGNSGLSRPTFSTTPNTTTTDVAGQGGPLQWRSIGNGLPYYQGCAIRANDGYRNNVLLQQATDQSEPTAWTPGMERIAMQTGDASAGTATGFSYTETNQHYGNSTLFTFNVPSTCLTANDANLTESSGTTAGGIPYWTGGTRFALCYDASTANVNTANPNSNGIASMRIKGLALEALAGYWMFKNDATWLNTQMGLLMQRTVETDLARLDIFQHLQSSQLELINNGFIAPYYQSGQVAEALLHYYQATLFYNASGFNPTGPDERIPVALKAWADTMWLQDYDRIYDANFTVTDACFALHPTICQGSRRLHSFSVPYDKYNISNPSVAYEFTTESGSNGEVGWVYSWLWTRDSTLVPPSNGRITVGSYRDVALNFFQHSFDGRYCTVKSSTVAGNCTSWNVADYVNGGRGSGAGYQTLVVNNKQPQQTMVNIVSEGLQWALGMYLTTDGVFMPNVNKCNVVANRDPVTGKCTTPSPFADTQVPTPFNLYSNGGKPNVNEPAVCLPGLAGNSTKSICVSSGAFGTNAVAMNEGAAGIGSNFADFNFLELKNSACSVTVGTTATEPVHNVGVNTFNDSAAPTLAGGTPVPLWFHHIHASGLTSSTVYHFGVDCTDSSGNAFHFPYQAVCPTCTPPRVAISYGSQEQGLTFLTQPAPPGANITLQFGVAISGGKAVVK